MSFTDAELAEVRTWVPWETDDAVLDDAADRLDNSLWRVIQERLRIRLMTLASSPVSFSIPGDYSQNTAENIRLLNEKLAEVTVYVAGELEDGAPGALAIGQLVRDDPSRVEAGYRVFDAGGLWGRR